jgi:hypothetical protein
VDDEEVSAVRRGPGRHDALEADWQRVVVDAAHAFGWRVAHFRPALTEKGWRTPVEADGKGWPDLVLVRDRVIYAELKSKTGRLSADQVEWVRRLERAGQECYVWRPGDFAEVERILRPGGAPGRSRGAATLSGSARAPGA